MPEAKFIREVWAENLEEEMAHLRDLVEDYPYLAMDTEFPGVVARPIGTFRTSSDYHYQTLRCNVDLLKIIQLGVTFADENGNLPENACTWQFNFRFNLGDDMYAQDSIDLLTKSGIDFQKHKDYGIDVEHFGELLISSGFVLLDDVKWISFHSGYDFGYLLKVLTCAPMPADEGQFFDLLRTYFPCIYDIKYLMKSCKNLKGGLQDIADDLQVTRIGPQHQAGSDSLLTSSTFFKMRQMFFEDEIDDNKYLGYLYGLHNNSSEKQNLQHAASSASLSSMGNHIGSIDSPITRSMGLANGSKLSTVSVTQLTPGEYHKASDLTLESILDVLETIGDEHDIDNYDVEYSQGVLTLKLGAKGTYVLNKQPPNQQIWLSSPKSGPKRYDYDAEHIKWFYARDNHTIDELLNEELTEALGFDVKLLE